MFQLFDGYSRTASKITKATDEATNKILNASGATDKLNKKLEATGASASTASSGLKKLVGAVASYAALTKGMNIADEYTNTAARLALINDGLQTQAELQEKIFASAKRARGSYTQMGAAISKLGLLAGDAFTSTDEIIGFTELMQKSFRLSGASPEEQAAGMYQLTQAMASGRLQGDEFRSITENAPMLAQAIATYMGKSMGELRELSAEGLITADVIKNALFMAAEDINTNFEKLPRTFGDVWTDIKNDALKAFTPVVEKVNNLINTDGFNAAIRNISKGLVILASITLGVIDAATWLGATISDNWSIIAPLIWGIVGALVVYNATMGIAWLTTLKTIGAKLAHAAASWAETAAILALIAAQDGLNAALAACPITWIIMGIIVLIAVFYAAIAVINKLAGTSLSATGIIMGTFAVALAFIFNLFVGAINAILQLIWTRFAEPFLGIIEWILNATQGGFDSFGGAVANLIGNIISWFLSLGKVVTKIIDAIFGTDWTSGLSSLQDKVLQWGKNEKAITINREAPTINKRIEYSAAWATGYNLGEKIEDKLSLSNLLGSLPGVDDSKGFDLSEFGTANNPLTVQGTGSNGKIKAEMSDEDLKYLRDIAERDYINKFSTATLAPQIEIKFGDVHEEADVDKVAARLRKILREEIAVAAEGDYA